MDALPALVAGITRDDVLDVIVETLYGAALIGDNYTADAAHDDAETLLTSLLELFAC